MKEVVRVSISGIPFTLDEDAFRELDTYLEKLNRSYAANPDGREIVGDIEARIAELLLSGLEPGEVSGRDGRESERAVSLSMVRDVIEQMGYPDDVEPISVRPAERFPRRLYRDPEGRVLGGVCSGLAAFFDTDPVWMRLIFCSPLLLCILCGIFDLESAAEFFGMMIPVGFILYFMLWLIVPVARSPRQRLEMRGERVSASSIGRDHARKTDSVPPRRGAASVFSELVGVAGRIVLFGVRVFVLLLALAFGMAALGVFIALVALVLWGWMPPFSEGWTTLPFLAGATLSPRLYASLLAFLCFVPLTMLVYWLLGLVFRFSLNRWFTSVVWGLWLVAAVFFAAVTFRSLREPGQGHHTTIVVQSPTYIDHANHS